MAQVWARPLCECGGVVARHHRLDGGRIPTGLTSGGGNAISHQRLGDRLKRSSVGTLEDDLIALTETAQFCSSKVLTAWLRH